MSLYRGFKPMKRWLAVLTVCSALGATTAAYAKGPEVDLVDNKLSINAEAIPLSRLLQMVDRATGMKSKVPPELANRNVTVRFSNLTMTDAVRKMFQGQPVDYVLIQGQGIIITSASQTGGEAAVSGGAYTQASAPPVDQPFTQEFPPAPGAIQQQPMPQQLPQGQPAMVQTPFGPVPNPRAQQQQQPNTPLNAPGQQNSLFPTVGNPAPGPAPTLQPGNPNPFGTTSPFGTPNQPANQNNSLFGNPQTFGGPGQR
jgi:hypothetical protein